MNSITASSKAYTAALTALLTSLAMQWVKSKINIVDVAILAQIQTLAEMAIAGGLAVIIAGIVGFATYIVPLGKRYWDEQMKSRLTNKIVAEVAADPNSGVDLSKIITNEDVANAQADPTSPVDLSKIIDDKMIIQAQLDLTSPATVPANETIESLEKKLSVVNGGTL